MIIIRKIVEMSERQQNIHGEKEPVQSQPWSSAAVAPMSSPSSSQGLDFLSQASHLMVKLRPKFLTGLRPIIYDIKNSMGQQEYTVTEDYNCLNQYFCSQGNTFIRSFTRRISDNTGCLVMEVHKPFEWLLCNYCGNTKTEVKTPSGEPMAYIVNPFSPCILKFKILNENHDEVLKIAATSCCGFTVRHFKITSIKEQTEVGWISMSTALSIFTQVLHFNVHFSPDLDVKMKAAIMAICLLFF
ncbi:phospholipid scramblase 1-like [Eleutherodactylus coqui]|uniref:phospholipid scramblase 1-like n=1 Tax=Eleutherodactylus coqui TaxID=57060 RepID=UPI003461958E